LRVTSPTVLEFILSAVVQQERQQRLSVDTSGASAVHGGSDDAVEGSHVFASLRVIEWCDPARLPEAAFDLIERHAANITDFNGPLLAPCATADKSTGPLQTG
jgi:hypothetical protein